MFQRRRNERNPEIPNEYDAELRELARKTQEVRARSAALEQERAHAEALEDERRTYRSSDRPLPLVNYDERMLKNFGRLRSGFYAAAMSTHTLIGFEYAIGGLI